METKQLNKNLQSIYCCLQEMSFQGKHVQHDGHRGNTSNGRNNRKLFCDKADCLVTSTDMKPTFWWYNLLVLAYLTQDIQKP